ncbi:MAG: AGE family epimerase/isomerase [Defluviitaleaceae bacterium]|nr:AGE family epimerase/isomerase [Defluviitaleaceae bacterium]
MNDKLKKLSTWAKEDLSENLLKWWAAFTVDEKNGGFYGTVRSDNTPDENASRAIVLNSRLVWTFSAAYAVTKNEKHKEMAERAYLYFTKHFYDDKFGGFHSEVGYTGRPISEHKFMYGNAFAVYGLSEYSRVFGCENAKKLAMETVSLMDENMWDYEHGGYFETATNNWKYAPEIITAINEDIKNQKTMNTHLHIMEAYANLLILADSGDSKALRSRTRELVNLFINKIINPTNHHVYYFQTRDWLPTTYEFSLGHDIEASWLLTWAAEVLGEPEIIAVAKTAGINLARAVYDDGIAESGAIHTSYFPKTRKFSENFSWWEQNEGVVGFLNAFQITGEKKFLDASLDALNFIDKHFIDKERGGWFTHVNSQNIPMKNNDKSGVFVCPYHNARMSIELINRV